MLFRAVLASAGCAALLVTSAVSAQAASGGATTRSLTGAVLGTAAGIAVDSCTWAANDLGYKSC